MQECSKISQISTLNSLVYADYLSFKVELTGNLTPRDLLQLRWVMTQASYLCGPSTILIVCKDPEKFKQQRDALNFLNRNIETHHNQCVPAMLYDMIIVMDDKDDQQLHFYYSRLKANGYLVLDDQVEWLTLQSTSEICGLKTYRKPVQEEDIDIKIHVFIPVHNGIKQTLKCLESLYNQSISNFFDHYCY